MYNVIFIDRCTKQLPLTIENRVFLKKLKNFGTEVRKHFMLKFLADHTNPEILFFAQNRELVLIFFRCLIFLSRLVAFENMSQSLAPVRLGHRASMRFNVLVVGEGRIGKSTFLSVLLSKYAPFSTMSEENSNGLAKTGIRNAGKLSLTSDCQVHMFESVGFGDNIDNSDSVDKIKSFLVSAHNKWNEMRWNRVTEQVSELFLTPMMADNFFF